MGRKKHACTRGCLRSVIRTVKFTKAKRGTPGHTNIKNGQSLSANARNVVVSERSCRITNARIAAAYANKGQKVLHTLSETRRLDARDSHLGLKRRGIRNPFARLALLPPLHLTFCLFLSFYLSFNYLINLLVQFLLLLQPKIENLPSLSLRTSRPGMIASAPI